MNYLMEGNRQSSLVPDQGRGRSTHQNAAHKLMRDAGYSFVRKDGNMHNHYRNEFDQEIVVVGSPKNSSEGINRLRTTIRRQQRQREEGIPVPTTVTLVDQFVAMADEFLLKPLPEGEWAKSPASKAKYAAYTKWFRRVIEKHGPQPIEPLIEATARMGLNLNFAQRARKDLGMVVYRDGGGTGSRWLTCFSYQVPDGHKVRELAAKQIGVTVEEPEEPKPEEEKPQAMLDSNGAHADLMAAKNGRPPQTEQQTAALMLLESLGIKPPGIEAQMALAVARLKLQEALEAVNRAEGLL